MAHDPSAFIQEYFQIRADDTAGLNVDDFDWGENVDGSIATGVPFRIRFKVRETAAGADSTGFKIQVSRNSGTWIDGRTDYVLIDTDKETIKVKKF